MATVSHHTIRESLLDRIQRGEWALGALIPGEVQLAREYGCARTTVNRALRALADAGLVVRKRRGGTRVTPLPVRQARLSIPVVREQVEDAGDRYSHQLRRRRQSVPPAAIRKRLGLAARTKALYLETLHLANGAPFAFETRWINPAAVPDVAAEELEQLSINEWLVRRVPFTSGEVRFSAVNADSRVAAALGVAEGTALFLVDRTTWRGDVFITTTALHHAAGYTLHSTL